MARGGIKPWQLFAALGVLIIFLFLAFTPQGNQLSGLNGNTGLNGNSGVAVNEQLQIGCVDPVAGANCGAVTVTLYQGSSSTVLETLTASASGVAQSTNKYPTGTQLTVEVSGNSKATEYLPVTVPTGYITNTYNVLTVYAVTLGAWSEVFTGTAGTTFTSGSQYQISQFAGSSPTITDSISETTSNAGFKSSYDIVNLLQQYVVVEVSDGGGASSNTQYATVTGLPNQVKSGNTNYYFVVCPDGISGSGVNTAFSVVPGSMSSGSASSICSGSLTLTTKQAAVPAGAATGGSAGFSFSLGVGSLTSGNTETFSFGVYYYASPAYFQANGNLGPNAAQSGSTFTIKFVK